jgi:1-phosphofructokinase family hexose kinase
MILCLSPNPAIDRTLVVESLVPGRVHRASEVQVWPDGKGVNVARAARLLGTPSVCAGFLGGETGKRMAQMVEAEGIAAHWTWIEGETRTNIIVVDHKGEATVINERGPQVTADDWARLHDDVVNRARGAAVVCVSGSLPPGTEIDAYIGLLQSLYLLGRSVWVDVSGEPLAGALAVSGINIKINNDEAATIFNREITTPEAALVAAQQLLDYGAPMVALTLGKQGAALATKGGTYWARPPKVNTRSSVGSGDTFLAGLVTSLEESLEPKEALRRAVAAGAANAIMLGSGRFDPAAFEQILALTASGAI